VHQLVLGQGDCSDCFLLMLHPLKLGKLNLIVYRKKKK
jgi:hypothetical protein